MDSTPTFLVIILGPKTLETAKEMFADVSLDDKRQDKPS